MAEPYDTLLSRLKIDLGIIHSTAYDSRLTSLLQVSEKEIEREGIKLDLTDVDDGELLIDYARDLWQRRRGDNPESAMSKSLRFRLNNRLFGKERKSQNPEVNDDG
jgi:hypothetical protein